MRNARSDNDKAGGPPVRTWLESNPKVTLGTFAEAAAHGEIVVNALSGQFALAGLSLAGEGALAGKILIDITNPLDFSKGAHRDGSRHRDVAAALGATLGCAADADVQSEDRSLKPCFARGVQK